MPLEFTQIKQTILNILITLIYEHACKNDEKHIFPFKRISKKKFHESKFKLYTLKRFQNLKKILLFII